MPFRRSTSAQSAARYRAARRERGDNAPRIHLDLARSTVVEMRRACEDRVMFGKATHLTMLAIRMLEQALGGEP